MLRLSRRTGKINARRKVPNLIGEDRFVAYRSPVFTILRMLTGGQRKHDVPVICVHGLSRQGRDFDYLAADLARSGRRVVCPDLVGRGRSGRLRDPNEYALPQYCADMNALIAHLGAEEVDWVGTSLVALSVSCSQDCREHRSAGWWSMISGLTCRGRAWHVSGRISVQRQTTSSASKTQKHTFAKFWRRLVTCPMNIGHTLTQHSVAWHAERERYRHAVRPADCAGVSQSVAL